jgi:hypothetical protein
LACKSIKSFICFALFYFIPFSYAEIYQWKDSNGEIRFSDKPPQEIAEVNKIEFSKNQEKKLFSQLNKGSAYLNK